MKTIRRLLDFVSEHTFPIAVIYVHAAAFLAYYFL
jgi:hypothetical protein